MTAVWRARTPDGIDDAVEYEAGHRELAMRKNSVAVLAGMAAPPWCIVD